MTYDRLDPTTVAPDLYKAVFALERYARGNLDQSMLHLVYLRASLINGCAFCIDVHSTEALAAGESTARLFGLAAWRETPLYTDAEQAALALTDAVTRVGDSGVPDGIWDAAREHFDDKALLDLVGAIALINVWNRLAITLRKTPPSATAS
jgi:AhpD family alkylhydroperoxidase